MPLSAFQAPVSSNPDTDFIVGLAQDHGSPNTDLVIPWRTPAQVFIRAITLIASENRAYELQLFNRAVNMGASIALDEFVAVWQFGALAVGPPASPGYPFTPTDKVANNLFHYYIDGNMMPYQDLDAMAQAAGSDPANPRLHVRLVNRSAAAKSADAAGALKVTFWVAPQGAQV